MLLRPCRWISVCSRSTTNERASFQDTRRHPDPSRIIGSVMRLAADTKPNA
jgi:hypothetical protein